MLSRLGLLWRGELPLIEAFWTWAALVTPLLWFGALALEAVGWRIAAFLAGIAWKAYCFVAARGVWRSAERYRGPRRWALIARIVSGLAQAFVLAQVVVVAYAAVLAGLIVFVS